MVNVSELQLALKLTEEAAAKGLWEQEAWFEETACGTAACFAGTYALYRGCKPVGTQHVITPDKEEVKVNEWVMNELGLSPFQATALFDAYNTLDDLRAQVQQLCEVTA